MSCCFLVSAAICCYLLPNMSPIWSKKPAKPPGMAPEGPQGVPRWPPGVSKRPPGSVKIRSRGVPGPLRTTSRDFEPELVDFGSQNRSKKRRKNVRKLIAFPDAVWKRFLYFFLSQKFIKKTSTKSMQNGIRKRRNRKTMIS